MTIKLSQEIAITIGTSIGPQKPQSRKSQELADRHTDFESYQGAAWAQGVSSLTHYRLDENYDSESEYLDTGEAEEPARRPWRVIAVALLSACLGSGLAFGWRYYGNDYAGLAGQKTEAKPDVTNILRGLQQSQQAIAADAQRIAADEQRNLEVLAAQQVEIKRLSEQIAQVAGNLDSLRASIQGAQASAPPPVEKPPQKKKPAPKPSIEQHNAAPPNPPSLAPEEKQ